MDSEDEFCASDTVSPPRSLYRTSKLLGYEPLATDAGTGSNSDSVPNLIPKNRAKPTKTKVERGTDVENSMLGWMKTNNFATDSRRKGIQSYRATQATKLGTTMSSSSSTGGTKRSSSTPPTVATDSEADNDLVEAMVDTESDVSPPPSRGVSFAFSSIESRNASVTSLSSVDSVDPTTGRKRTLVYGNTWGPIIGSSNSRKATRTSQDSTASSPAPPTPQTPTRSVLTTPSSPASPSSYHKSIETPTMARVCTSFSQAIAFSPSTSSSTRSHYDDQMMVVPTTPSGVYIIAHDKQAQEVFDKSPLSWGVQYELARGVSNGQWSWAQVIRAKLGDLAGPTNNAAARVPQVLRHVFGTISPNDMLVWSELDREEAANTEGRSRGLGLQGDWKEKSNWYGGQVQQVARLELVQDSFRLVLAKMEMRKSHRFGRFLTSRRLLQVSIPQALVNSHKQKLDKFFKQRFVLCGRVFILCGSKDNKAFLLEISEDYERACHVPGDTQRLALDDFVNWHNPVDLNGSQPVAKYTTRFDLGFSISVPVLSFLPDNMFYMDDDYAPHDPNKKIPAECIYTDGCGYMNGAALSAIARQMGLETRPVATQGRIAGAKGLWVLHPRNQSPTGTPKIWIRNSQVKIQLDLKKLHPAHRMFDLVAPPRVTVPSRLSRLTILNLAHNGVPVETFVELMKDTLDAEVKLLTDWAGPKAMLLLWKAVEKVGGVTMTRIIQHAQGAMRAMGLTGHIREDDTEWDDTIADPKLKELADQLGDVDENEMPSVNTLRDPVTGEPLSIHGVVMDLIQAGFHPTKLRLLYDKLKIIIDYVIKDIIQNYHISVPLSAEAFIVPDPYGVLEEGEIHFKSSKNLKDPVEDLQPHILLGEVLIYRNPCRLPSDVRKVTAVHHAALSEYVDVIVLPTKGPCSFASILAGGDYDGDVCVCVYDPRLVDRFQNSEISCPPPNFLKDNFEDQGKIQQVSEMAAELAQLSGDPEARRHKLQDCLLLGLSTAPVGAYSKFHENAAYVHGYNAPETIRFACMFNTVLDSRKTGHRVKPEVYRRDKLQYDREQPACLKSTKEAAKSEQGDVAPLRRNRNLDRFILDDLLEAGKKMRDEHLVRYDRLTATASFMKEKRDPDLIKPFERIRPFLDHLLFKEDLAQIKAHVDAHIPKWQIAARESKTNPKTPSKRSSFKSVSASKRSQREKWEELVRSFAAGPEIAKESPLAAFGDIEQLKASWAYAEKPELAWKVAFQALCRIKASTRNPVAFTGEFADVMSIPGSAGRILEQCRLTAQGVGM